MLLFKVDTIRSVRSKATPMVLINRPGFVHTEGVVNGRSMLSGEWLGAALMGDFKTAWMTLCSPRSMFLAQVVGSFLGCIIAPATFLLFYKAFDIGVPGSAYPAPYATIYRAMAVLGVEVCSPRYLNPKCMFILLRCMFLMGLLAFNRHHKHAAWYSVPSCHIWGTCFKQHFKDASMRLFTL